MAKEGVDVGAIIDVPGLDSAIQGTAEQLMCALAEGQARDGIPVPREALHTVASIVNR